MEAKTVIAYEFEKEGRIYRLTVPYGAPLGEAYEATSGFLTEMVRMINEHAESSKPKEPEVAEDPESEEE